MPGRRRPCLAASPASSRRWKLIGSDPLREQRVVEVAQAEGIAEAALLVVSQAEDQDLAEQVRELVGRRDV